MGELPDGRIVKVRSSNEAGRGRYTIDSIKKTIKLKGRLDMVNEINFNEIMNSQSIQNEVRLLYFNFNYLTLNKFAVDNKGWFYAQMEEHEKQIIENDAYNLSETLKIMGCKYIYNATAENLLQQDNFEVLQSSIDAEAIEVLNNYWHEIPNSDSFIFSDYPLKFLIMRSIYTENKRLYYIGEKSFIKNACKGDCWEFY